MPIFAAIRLARFNTDETQKESFKGLASPASALAVISLALALEYADSVISRKIICTITGNTILTIALSYLMVCRLPMISLKFHDMKLKGNWDKYLLIICIALTMLLFGFKAAPFIIPIYISISILSVLAPRK
jgi:CDP-diacylglycerol--serine O-phosphatidyltransferase